MADVFELTVGAAFAAAHNLRGYEGSCERLHGHNWKIDITLRGSKLDKLGMLVDFRDVKAMVSELLDELDHRYLNEIPAFQEDNPTTENVAKWLAGQLAKRLPSHIRVAKVTAWESDNCGASYLPDDTLP